MILLELFGMMISVVAADLAAMALDSRSAASLTDGEEKVAGVSANDGP
jgi:hypothetical protein